MVEVNAASMPSNEDDASHPFIGLFLSVISACLVGSSFIFQKKGIIHSKMLPTKGTN